MKQQISTRQLTALSFVSMLSPFLRLVPGAVTQQAGSAAWVSAVLSLLPTGLLALMIGKLLKSFPHSMGFPTMIQRILGGFWGKVLVFLWSAWLIFHSGFLLRSGAQRFTATIYPNSGPAFFVFVTAAMCAAAAWGHIKPLARSTEIFRPLLLFVILLVLLFSAQDVEPTFLLPVTTRQLPHIAAGIPLAAESASVALVNMAFLYSYVQTKERKLPLRGFLVGAAVLNVLFCVICVGTLGATYTAAPAYPFFIMARDLSVLSGVERIEALVVGLWLLPDFVLIAVELLVASEHFMALTERTPAKNERLLWIVGSTAAACGVAFLIGSDSLQIRQWSDQIIPAIHLFWAFLVIPLLLTVSHFRTKF